MNTKNELEMQLQQWQDANPHLYLPEKPIQRDVSRTRTSMLEEEHKTARVQAGLDADVQDINRDRAVTPSLGYVYSPANTSRTQLIETRRVATREV